jgi:hypothetical protein
MSELLNEGMFSRCISRFTSSQIQLSTIYASSETTHNIIIVNNIKTTLFLTAHRFENYGLGKPPSPNHHHN